MSCTSPFALGSHEDLHDATSSGADARDGQPVQRRRHSFFIPRRKSIVNHLVEGEEGLLLKVDLFLSELERRLEYLETYGELSFDSSISRAYSTLQAVRSKCSQASEGVIGAGRRRLHVMVETLDARYHDALIAAESMNEKARVGIELMDNMLTDYESRALKLRDQGFAGATGAANSLMGEGRRVVDEGIERAKRAAETLEEHIQHAITRAKAGALLKYEELPVPWRVNPHILSGYRFSETKLGCVRSMFNISNETVNIWTHALGLLLVLSIAFYFYPTSTNFSLSTKTDVFIAAVFFFAACKCLACSTIWHTMNCVADQTLLERFACVDYTGIALLIAASIMTTEYAAFYCEPISRWIYMTTTALLGVGGVIMPWHPYFNRADKAWLRVGFFIGLGATGFLPIFQIMYTRGPSWAFEFYTGSNLVKSLSVYVLGACIYASKVPERWLPGTFDYFGNAHNLWHVAVLGGILYHYVAMQEFFSGAFRRAEQGCPMY
ncbi:hemolysin-III related-domain-containing protein [Pseudomassariella vexata]|uniref:Hemolysin-III related-domain-containing protein n=1 Tax=Pseudomassariella vexata TaxID=1141098 RepID=A0A1Y2E343_9PEZI|nr:hemolysin-III related-domain-containing protein [Pseudomassariella vexata]ORY65867.1 hemolysin-III related-domain-containing protein [Pseudomassariella vexata]